jgi:periplasmic divalent cation tolerance protein
MSKFCVVLVTCGSLPEAKRIGGELVKQKLAACVNIIPQINSIFFWKGRLSQEKETLLLIKTRSVLFSNLVRRIKNLHSYEVPEIIALPILAAEKNCTAWLKEQTAKAK